MRSWYIGHKQDLIDFKNKLDNIKIPYRILIIESPPTKEHGDEYEKKRKQNAFFHRAVIPTYSDVSGLGYDECKIDLLQRFSPYIEEENSFEVESISGMSNKQMAEFVERCTQFLIQNFGEIADEMLINNVNKTKRIKK